MDFERPRTLKIPWLHSERYNISSQMFSKKQSISYLEETNTAYLEALEGEAAIGEIREEAFLNEPTREHVPGIDLNMAIDVKGNSFDKMNRATVMPSGF